MSKKEQTNKKEDWMQKQWRPMMAIMYMIVCVFDFILFPIMFTVVQFWETEAANDAFRQWQPLTLIGAGLFHMAMGAVLGLTAWGRTQEKLNGSSNNAVAAPTPVALPPPSMQPTVTAMPMQPTKVSTMMPTGQVVTGYGGKPAPIQPPDPEI